MNPITQRPDFDISKLFGSATEVLSHDGVTLSPCATTLLNEAQLTFLVSDYPQPTCTRTRVLYNEMNASFEKNIVIWHLCCEVTDQTVPFVLMVIEQLTAVVTGPVSTMLKHIIGTRSLLAVNDIVSTILAYDIPQGKVFHFATETFVLEGLPFLLSFIHGESYGKYLFAMPVTDTPVCHPGNYWVHAEESVHPDS